MNLKNLGLININTVIAAMFATLAAYMTFPNYFEANIYPLPVSTELWTSLDPSWLLHLNYAQLKGYTWGSDIAFTYGPLSYLSTKVGWGHNGIDFLLYDLFCFINFFLIFFLSYKESRNKIITALLIAIFCIVFPVWIGSSNAVILMAFLIFWIRRSLGHPNPGNYIAQIVILTLVFFIKFNTGLVAIPLFYSGILYNMIVSKKNKKALLIIVIASFLPLVLIPIFASSLNVNLPAYIKSGMEMISGYNEVMYFEHKIGTRITALSVFGIALAALIFKTVREKRQGLLKNLFILFLFGSAIFILYKQGFVRGMEYDFFIFSVLLILVIPDLHVHRHHISVPILALSCGLISFVTLYQRSDVKFSLKEKTNKLYLAGFNSFTPISGLHLFPNDNQLPVDVKREIGTSTVDVYPWNLQMLIENKLNISARPVFQSYSAYTPYLEQLNFDHYNSKSAPEFIIYEVGSIDSRYFLFDEPKLNLVITKNYTVNKVFDFQGRKLILLEKNKIFKPITLTKVKEYAMLTGMPLVPKHGTYYEIEIFASPIAALIGVIDHAPEIKLDVFLASGNQMSFRTSKKLLQTGVFSTTYVKSTEGLAAFMQNQPSEGAEPVRYYKFRAENPSFFKDKIKITEYKITQ